MVRILPTTLERVIDFEQSEKLVKMEAARKVAFFRYLLSDLEDALNCAERDGSAMRLLEEAYHYCRYVYATDELTCLFGFSLKSAEGCAAHGELVRDFCRMISLKRHLFEEGILEHAVGALSRRCPPSVDDSDAAASFHRLVDFLYQCLCTHSGAMEQTRFFSRLLVRLIDRVREEAICIADNLAGSIAIMRTLVECGGLRDPRETLDALLRVKAQWFDCGNQHVAALDELFTVTWAATLGGGFFSRCLTCVQEVTGVMPNPRDVDWRHERHWIQLDGVMESLGSCLSCMEMGHEIHATWSQTSLVSAIALLNPRVRATLHDAVPVAEATKSATRGWKHARWWIATLREVLAGHETTPERESVIQRLEGMIRKREHRGTQRIGVPSSLTAS